MVGADIDPDLFKVLERVARLQQTKREQYIHIESLKSMSDYRKLIKRLVSLGLIGYYKTNKFVKVTHDGGYLSSVKKECKSEKRYTR